jgi:hypothetical protein
MSLRAYPTSLDLSIWTELLSVIEGQKKPDAHSVHCLEDAIAFGLGQAYPDVPAVTPAPVKVAQPTVAMTKEQAAAICRTMIAANGAASAHMTAAPAGMSWAAWIAFIAQLLQQIAPLVG